MTPEFVVAAWGPESAPRCRVALTRLLLAWGLTVRVDLPDFTVLARIATSTTGADGLVIGDLYGGVPSDGGLAADRTAHAAGNALVASAWGRYCAVIATRRGRFGMIDPSGAFPCHLAKGSGTIIMSDALSPRLLEAAGISAKPCLAAVADCIAHPPSAVHRPLLSCVDVMTPGVLYPLGDAGELLTIWSPRRLSTANADGCGALRSAVDSAVAGMAGGRPLVQLSGGLDSSVVIASVVANGRPAAAFNFHSGDGDVDEVAYAREVAASTGTDLIVVRAEQPPDYSRIASAGQTSRPWLYGLDDVFETAAAGACMREGTDRMLTGQGGDAAFLRTHSPLISVDRRLDLGCSAAFLRAAAEDALRSRRSIWHHLRPAFGGLKGSASGSDLLVPQLLAEPYRSGARASAHPWARECQDLPPGKRLHAELLANCQLFHSARPFSAVRVLHPLLAQPVLECVLAMPSWQLADGPLDRGLARRAFHDRLPLSVRGRSSKGEASSRFSRAAVANLAFLRPFLLEGALADTRIIDVDALDRALTTDQLFHSLDYRAVAVLTSHEAWLRAWL